MKRISELAFEEQIEHLLTLDRPDYAALAEDDPVPGGYAKRPPASYDADLCLLPADTIDFIQATQPETWEKFTQHHGADARPKFLKRLAGELRDQGALKVLRHGIKDSGCRFDLAYFPPASGLNAETRRLHTANFFSVVRQVHFSAKCEKSLDLVLFLNGIPLFTFELKNTLNGQTVEDAIRQYKRDRSPKEPLFAYRRCLAHFALDPNLVYVTTKLEEHATRFLPFNTGYQRGSGNAPVPPSAAGYSTDYLWLRVLARESVLDLVRHFIHEVEVLDEDGRKTGRKELIFPRHHQLDAVRNLVAASRREGTGRRYLIQHSAGSGKSNTIAWLAHRLAILHDAKDERVFHTIIVITDRKVLDAQLQHTIHQFEQTLGVVENIDKTSRQLKQALEDGKTIIVTTLQKFPVIADEIGELPGKRFAVIVDEAHSSQSGESSKSLKKALSVADLEEAEKKEAKAKSVEDELEDAMLAEVKARGKIRNLSMFAFTATPKGKTLELFGTPGPDGKRAAFHLYSMRQAIEENFILDVLGNYATYKSYWKLLKTIEEDPKFDRRKASGLLKSFVELHPHSIANKVRIMLDHFETRVKAEIGGQAKAMVVTRSRLHAVRYFEEFRRQLAERRSPYKALVAFSGTVSDGMKEYTEPGLNSEGLKERITESQTAGTFKKPDYRFLIVANKFQTGFDQPLLHTMYVDKILVGLNAVQTLSRLNRTHPGKSGTMVLDFANEAETIREAFQDYYEATILSESTDPNLLYQKQSELLEFGVYTEADVEAFAKLYFNRKVTQDRLYAALAPFVQRFHDLQEEEQFDFRERLNDYRRLYAFLAQVMPFEDPGLEKLYQFARHLRKLLPLERKDLPVEIRQSIDMESYRLQETGSGKLALESKTGTLPPMGGSGKHAPTAEELEPLSKIIAALNDRFGLNLGPEDRITIGQVMEKMGADPALEASVRVNPRDHVRLTFQRKFHDIFQDIVDSNFKLYKNYTNNPSFGEALLESVFNSYLRERRPAIELIKFHESKTLEFKSTLRFSMKEGKPSPAVSHAALKTVAAFLNTDGGELLLGVDDDKTVVGIERDGFENEDKFLRHLMQLVINALGDRSGTCVDPTIEVVEGKAVCVVRVSRSPEPVFLTFKAGEKKWEREFYIRNGPRTDTLAPESVERYIETRWPAVVKE